VNAVVDFISSNNASIAFIQETWLQEMNNHTTAVIKASGYLIYHHFRNSSGGGGVAILYKPNIKLIRVFINHGESFESVSAKVVMPSGKGLFCSCIYRTGSLTSFFHEIDEYLTNIYSRFEKVLICGDFNIHMDKISAHQKEFNRIITSYGLHQLVDQPTHKAGHILDLLMASHKIIKRNSLSILSPPSQLPTCDHCCLIFTLECDVAKSADKKKITFRNIKKMDRESFRADLESHLFATTSSAIPSLEEKVHHYNTGISNILDLHAPKLSKWIRDLPDAKWFDSEYKEVRIERRKAEKLWKNSGLEIDRDIFEHLRTHCNELADSKKISFFKHHFEKYSYSQKSLYSFVDTFLDHEKTLTLPPTESLQECVDDFNTYFNEKIVNIRKSFSPVPHQETRAEHEFVGKHLSDFDLATVEEIAEILKETTMKSCDLDPIPAELMKENLDLFIPELCDIVNLSLTTGSMDGLKSAHLTPLIKGDGLDCSVLKNYRPVSNLAFVGKLIEKVVQRRLSKHMEEHNLNMKNQSAYKKNFSTETLLIRVVNDLLIAADENKATVVMLLDLSAAFDTVEHSKLLHILHTEIGITGNALSWFKSYLSGRCQRVKIGDKESIEIVIRFGVPQGSVLGPILFNIYIRSLYGSINTALFNVHGFADDHQVFKSFRAESEYQVMTEDLPMCFRIITEWMDSHYLQLNPGKTEIMVFGSQSTLSKLQLKGVFIKPDICVRLVPTAKNLGFHLDSGLTFAPQVNKLKMSCCMKLRNIARMKPFLTTGQMQSLVQALVISSLDYCNGLYFGASCSVIKKLQQIQNRACATIFGLKRKDSKKDHLQKLHWLQVPERIKFKIILLVYKTLHGLAPPYLSELIYFNPISGSRSPSLRTYLAKSSLGDRAFICCAAKLWNDLPSDIRECVYGVNVFKSMLKTYLFKKSYNIC